MSTYGRRWPNWKCFRAWLSVMQFSEMSWVKLKRTKLATLLHVLKMMLIFTTKNNYVKWRPYEVVGLTMKHDFRSHVSWILRDQMSLFCATGPDVRANNKSDRISENWDSTSQKHRITIDNPCKSAFQVKIKAFWMDQLWECLTIPINLTIARPNFWQNWIIFEQLRPTFGQLHILPISEKLLIEWSTVSWESLDQLMTNQPLPFHPKFSPHATRNPVAPRGWSHRPRCRETPIVISLLRLHAMRTQKLTGA